MHQAEPKLACLPCPSLAAATVICDPETTHLLTPPESTSINRVWPNSLDLLLHSLVAAALHSVGAAAVQPNPNILSH